LFDYNPNVPALTPLFPLPLVLFPDTSLPLHIFEPRYREMIGECLRLKQPFGVVRATDDGFARAGCTAEIMEVTKRYDDGRMDILTLGQQRFEIASVDSERSFLRGELKFFEDERASEATHEQRQQALSLQAQLLSLSGEAAGKTSELPEEHPQLSFQLAAAIPLDLDFKQAMLTMRAEEERLKALISYYEALLPRLRHALHARTKAGGNGHALNH
jgi:Lon protease-like protein